MAPIKTSPERRLTGLRLTHIAGFVFFWSVTAVHGGGGGNLGKRGIVDRMAAMVFLQAYMLLAISEAW